MASSTVAPSSWLADVTPANPFHGQLVAGLWLMGLIAAGSLVLAVYLWRFGNSRSSVAHPARRAEAAAAPERLISQSGTLAAAAALALASVALVWWMFDSPDDAGILGRALTAAAAVLTVILAVALVAALARYIAARRRASRSASIEGS